MKTLARTLADVRLVMSQAHILSRASGRYWYTGHSWSTDAGNARLYTHGEALDRASNLTELGWTGICVSPTEYVEVAA